MRMAAAVLGFALPLATCVGRTSPGQHMLEAMGSDDSAYVASRIGPIRSSSACDPRSLAGCEMQPRLALTTDSSAHRFVPKDDTELLSAVFTMWNVLDSLMRRHEPTHEFQAGYLRELQLRRMLQPMRELQLRRMLQLARELPARSADEPWQYCEVGMNGGHSLAAMLQADPRIHATVFDLMAYNYSAPVAELLRTTFGAARIQMIQGDSHTTLKQWAAEPANQRSCDLIFIDGDHTRASERDLREMQPAARPGAKIVVDDLQMAPGNAMRTNPTPHPDPDPNPSPKPYTVHRKPLPYS
jgi:predicted O-methyltransferase YrrM